MSGMAHRYGICVCGCGTETDRTFAPGHNRRVQGVLLGHLATGVVPPSLLQVYVDSLTKPPTCIGFNPSPGQCLAGCGRPTKAVFSAGCGIRFGDAMLVHLAGHVVTTDANVPVDEIIMVWRERQLTSIKAWARNRRHDLPNPR
jgi:hypothetical protein